MQVPFAKVQSIGNDFVLIEAADLPELPLEEVARSVCRRRLSVGSDGLLVIAPEEDAIRLRMFNPDGSEDFCGNGLRCAALYAWNRGWAQQNMTILHLGREVEAAIDPTTLRISTVLEPASFEPSVIPLDSAQELYFEPLEVAGRNLVLSALTTGSAHTVILVAELPDNETFLEVSSELEAHPLFPERTSVIWAQVRDEECMHIRIWERGAGETLGCGTGSSAAAAVYFRRRQIGGSIEIVNPGGRIWVEMASWNSPITIEGQAEIVYRGRVTP
jgi:diaminopimelate epimerase